MREIAHSPLVIERMRPTVRKEHRPERVLGKFAFVSDDLRWPILYAVITDGSHKVMLVDYIKKLTRSQNHRSDVCAQEDRKVVAVLVTPPFAFQSDFPH